MAVSRFMVAVLILSTTLPTTSQAASPRLRYPLLLVRGSEPGPSLYDPANHDRPCNLVIPGALRSVLLVMWERSPTFRLQCVRISAESRVVVRLHITTSLTQSRGRAASRMARDPAGALAADVYLASRIAPVNLVELIAHELEHLVEQLDGLALEALARRAPATVWQSEPGAFETVRAIRVGQIVAADVNRES